MSWLASRNRVVPRGSVSVTLSDPLVSVERSGSVDVTVTINRSTMAGGNATVEVTGLPTGVTASVGALSNTTRKTATCVVTLSAASDAPTVTADGYTVTVALDGGARGLALGQVTVPAPAPGPLFVLSTQTPVNVVQGGSTAVAVSVVRAQGFTADIALAIDEALPSGVSATFDPTSFTGGTVSGTLTLAATAGATPGQQAVTIRGTATGSDDGTTELTFAVVASGSYARFAPLYDLPRNEAGTALGYDASTGGTTGDVYKPTMPNPATLAATTNVVTVKASGGDYTPAQFQTALDAATNDTTQSWTIVVDSGLDVARSYSGGDGLWRVKSRPASPISHWLHIVSSDWYDGTWTPSASAHFDTALDVLSCFNLVNTHTWTGNGQGAVQLRIDAENVRVLGCHIQKPTSAGNFAQAWPMLWVQPTAKNVVIQHSLVNGENANGQFNCHVGIRVDATNVYIGNSASIGLARVSTETTALYSSEQGHHQYEWVALEAASINYFTGGLQLPYPEATVHDVVFRKCYAFKRQDFNPASHLNIGVLCKNLFEPKYGIRMLAEDSVWENSFVGDQSAMGIALSVTNQLSAGVPDSRDGYVYEVSNITFLHCIVRDVLAVTNAGGYTERVNTKGMHNIEFVNCLGLIGRMDRHMRASQVATFGTSFGWTISGGKRPPSTTWGYLNAPESIGNLKHRWCTIGYKPEKDIGETVREGIRTSWRTAYATTFDGTAVEDCVLMDSANHAVNLTAPATFPETGTVANRVAALWETATDIKRTVMVKQAVGASRLRMTEADFIANGNYPDQEDPDFFSDSRTDLFEDPANGDYSLKTGHPAKGKGAGGFDPGVDMALLTSRTANVRAIPDGVAVEWVAAP